MLAIGLPMTGIWEWVIVLVVVLIFFGAGKLPSVLGQMGKGVRAFKDGMKDDENEQKSIEASATNNAKTGSESFVDAEEVRR